MDFVGVCRHTCKTVDGNEASEAWDASRFERDERVSGILLPQLTTIIAIHRRAKL